MNEINLVVGVRFSKVGKVYHFDASKFPDLQVGNNVIVETSRGRQLGEVVQIIASPAGHPEGSMKAVDRKATPRDLILRQTWQQKESEVLAACKKRSEELGLKGLKFVVAEFSLDGMHLTVLYGTETEEKVDIKSLRGDIQRIFTPAQVEMRGIGPRDVAKIMCGMGACGLEMRCCSRFLTDFSSISIKMAKEQGISLTPTEITGMCGRLRCCLIYEYQNYVEARQQLPKKNKRVKTPMGEGRVLDVSPIRGMVLVELPETGRREFHKDEIEVLEDGSMPEKKVQETTAPFIKKDGAAKFQNKRGRRRNDTSRR